MLGCVSNSISFVILTVTKKTDHDFLLVFITTLILGNEVMPPPMARIQNFDCFKITKLPIVAVLLLTIAIAFFSFEMAKKESYKTGVLLKTGYLGHSNMENIDLTWPCLRLVYFSLTLLKRLDVG